MKICVFDVDLGLDISETINNDIQELTSETRTQLDETIKMAKIVQKVRIETEEKKKSLADRITTCMNTIYSKLVETYNIGIPSSELLSLISDVISTQSAFTLRMNKILFDKGNPYKLINKKVNGVKMTMFVEFTKD